jgi:broad specificity phosphatase PhoE
LSVVVNLVRHGEVEHHRTDVSITARGREQAQAAGVTLANCIDAGEAVTIRHSPVTRVKETAEFLRAELVSALAAEGRMERVAVSQPHPDDALCNVRFILGPGLEPEEPAVVYATINTPAYLQSVSPARAEFYRGFWNSDDPMGYWLTHDSAGAAETPEVVLARVRNRIRALFAEHNGTGERLHWIGVTHSGTMRDVLREAFGQDPGEPDFCAIITLEPSGHADRVRLTYHDQSALLDIAHRQSPITYRKGDKP